MTLHYITGAEKALRDNLRNDVTELQEWNFLRNEAIQFRLDQYNNGVTIENVKVYENH